MKIKLVNAISTRKLFIIFVLLIPAIIYSIQAYALRNWIVDDAGISFVYSRNVAGGAGFVSQPGNEPVECFSNFSWVVFLVPFFKASLFDLPMTPKLLSLLLVLATFFIIYKNAQKTLTRSNYGTLIVLILISISTPFVVWTSSGLENPLYVFLIALLAWMCLQDIHKGEQHELRHTILSSVIASAIAMTRPDGVLYFFAFPIVWTISGLKSTFFTKTRFFQLGIYILGISLIFGGFIVFRFTTFGDWLPNTYYAKGGPTFDTITGYILLNPGLYGQLYELFSAAANRYSGWLIAFVIFSGIFFGARKQLGKNIVILLFLALSIANYILLPKDWMKEFRFATPFLPFLYLAIVSLLENLCGLLSKYKRSGLIVFVISTIFFIVFSIKIYFPRTITFINQPTVPFEDVRINLGQKFNRYADLLSINHGSFLVPDLGGTLYESHLRVYDLVGLCDVQIAKTIGKNQSAFYQYIFEETRPTFIHLHWPWSIIANLDADPRFRKDYVAIIEERDANGQVAFGDYVRADAISGKEDALKQLQP